MRFQIWRELLEVVDSSLAASSPSPRFGLVYTTEVSPVEQSTSERRQVNCERGVGHQHSVFLTLQIRRAEVSTDAEVLV